MLHCFTPGLTCLYNVSLTSSQGGFEAETVLLKCWWEISGSFSSAVNSGFVSSNVAVLSCSHLSPSKDLWMCLPEILFHNTGCMSWSKCREGPLTGLLSSPNVVMYSKTKDQTSLCGSTSASCSLSLARDPCEWCRISTRVQGSSELGVVSMKASCTWRDLVRKLSGTCVNSSLPDLDGIQGVMWPSHAEVATQYSNWQVVSLGSLYCDQCYLIFLLIT